MKMLFLILLLLPINIKGLTTSSYIIMDMDNLNILEEKNKDKIRSIASISKIMTAILAIENNDVNKKIIVGDEISKSYGSGIYIKIGEELTIKDLLMGLMLRSGNDAALVLAKNTSGSIDKFVELMNKKAVEIGMKNTTFNNPHGLEVNGGNLSTAFDMAILTSYAMKNEIYKELVSTKKYNLETNMNCYIWYNKNKLLHKYNFITGGKTGYTEIAKRTLVTTASKDNMNFVIVTLNDSNDFKNHIDLYNKYFKEYHNYKILKKGKINILNENLYKDNLFIDNDYNITLNKNPKILLNYKLYKLKKYKINDSVGKIEIFINDKKIKEVPIIYRKGHDE